MTILSKALERYRKRRTFTASLDGEPGTFRTMTKGEAHRVSALPAELRTALVMAFCMLEDDGSYVFNPQPNETDEQFAARVELEISDIQTDKLRDINLAIAKVTRLPDMEKLVGNSGETQT